ncbi:MAG: methyl-accepting chemotaxis protein [Gammaproteobacteria bacterium]|nr:methyl-accepting chemotaxis protein [Gammaproteobacteria bacterium]
MLNRLRIGPRLLLLISLQAALFIAVGITAVMGLRAAAHGALRSGLFAALSETTRGHLAWEQAQLDVLATKNLLTSLWDEYQADKSPQEISALGDTLAKYHDLLMLTFSDLDKIFAEHDQEKLASYQDAQLKRLTMPFLTELNERIAGQQLQSELVFQQATTSNWAYLFGSIVAVVCGLAIIGVLSAFVYRSIAVSVNTISATVNGVAGGDYYARTGLSGADELSTLGCAFDHLLDERVATLLQVEQDNERFNDVATMLLHAAAKLRSRDSLKMIPATEDVTGSVVAALNQLTGETVQVLIDVGRIAGQIAKTSVVARTQSDIIGTMASNEQSEIDTAARTMTHAASALKQVAQLSLLSNQTADIASEATHTALHSVTQSVSGINALRKNLQATEQCIKRLDERSHDVWRTGSLLNSIAERAQVLALNASMHTAAPSGSDNGIAALSGDMQHLAETARAAAQQITELVSNIQSDVEDTVLSFNFATTQAVAGCEFAEQAGTQMGRTNDLTQQLIESVRQIASVSAEHMLLSSELQARTQTLQVCASKTREQIQEQAQHTKRLIHYSKGLMSSLQAFAHTQGEPEAALTPSADAATQLNLRAS